MSGQQKLINDFSNNFCYFKLENVYSTYLHFIEITYYNN